MLMLPLYYIRWHYTLALLDMVRIVGNFIWFFYEFFSIPLLLKTLFTPFERITDDRKKRHKLDFEAMGEAVLVNTIMRIVGMMLRLTLVLLGVLCIVCTMVVGCVLILVWVGAPLVLVGTFTAGVTLLTVG